jgi:hypothetical protein
MFTHRPQPEPLPLTTEAAFQSYVNQHHLSLLDVALASQVRYLTVWNIAHQVPVRVRHAAQVRVGLQRLTGVAYTAPIALIAGSPEQSLTRKEGYLDVRKK